jgi:hypothetical protein
MSLTYLLAAAAAVAAVADGEADDYLWIVDVW